MTGPRQPTVVVALHDGFYGCGTGAGHSNRALLDALIDRLPTDVRLVVLPVRLDITSPEYDLDWHTETTTMLTGVDAIVYPVDNGTAGQVRFGGLDCFRHLVRHTADILTHRVLPNAAPVLILALDAAFLGLTTLLPVDVVPNLVLIPRSTARIHAPSEQERIAWESHGLRTAIEHGGRIATISQYMRTHLSTDYRVPDHALTELPDGLSPPDWQFTPLHDALLPAPARDGFLLAMGRAQPYKGFDDLLDALTLLPHDLAVPHLVLAAVTDNPELSDYQRHLAKEIITRDLTEQIIHKHTGYAALPEDPASLANAVAQALALTPAGRHRMRENARQFAAARYDYPCAVVAFLKQVAPWLSS